MSKPIRIWLLAENWPPRRGGIENYLSHIAEELAKDHSVTVFAPLASTSNQLPVTSYQLVRRRFFWPLVRPKWLPLFIALWQRAKEDPPDIIIAGKGLFEGLIGYYFDRQRGIPYVVCTYAMEIATWSSRRGTNRKLRRVLKNARAVTYINDVTQQQLLGLGVAEQQLMKLLPGVDPRFISAVAPPLAESTARHFGITSPYVLSVGRLVPRKGFATLIEAFSQLDQTKHAHLKLVILGDGPDRLRLEQIVADNYMQTSVVWLTAVDDKYLPALYAGAELFALIPQDIAGDIEGFGIVYLEAAAMGKATLGTTSGGVGEAVVHDGTGLLVEPTNVAATAAALTRLLSDGTLRKRLGEAGQARVRETFQWASRRETLKRLIQP